MPELSEERRLIQESAREFTLERVRPLADKLDPVKGDIPRELIDEMAELGYFGILIPEEYGGLGLGAFEYCLVAEELARGWMSVASHDRARQLADRFAECDDARAEEPSTSRAWRAASFSAPSRCPSLMPARTWPTSPAGRSASATNGRSPATSTGAPSPTGPTSSSSSHAPTRPSIRKPGTAASRPSWSRSRAASCRRACSGAPDPQDRLLRLDDMGTRLRQLPRARRRT